MNETVPTPPRPGERIAKVMARAGLCSRRDAEVWISEGRVSVNGEVLSSAALNVSGADDVRVDGVRLARQERTRLFMHHKPRGVVTTEKDPEGRPTLFGGLPPDLPRVVAVGRLDINTEGLILLTNDGGLARVLELPSTGWLRRYRVRVHGEVTQAALDPLIEGITIEGIHYAGIEVKLDREQGSNAWLTMGLREGKNREIKRVLEHLGLSVNRLIRLSFGPFELRDLGEGETQEIPTRVLREQLGPKLSQQAGADFDAAVRVPAPAAAEVPRAAAKRGDGGERPRRRSADFGPPGARERRPREGEPVTKRLPIGPSFEKAQTRKHVTTLRTERAEDAEGPRRRVERGTTGDRKGRVIQVERITHAAPARPEKPARTARRGESPGGGGERPRFEGARGRPAGGAGKTFAPRGPRRDEGAAERPRAKAGGAYADRGPGRKRENDGPAKSFAPRGPRREGTGGADRPRAKSGGDFAPRSAGTFGGRGPERERSSGGSGGSGKPFAPRGPRREGEGAERPRAKSGGDFAVRGSRPPRAEGFGARPPRREGDDRRSGGRPPGGGGPRRGGPPTGAGPKRPPRKT